MLRKQVFAWAMYDFANTIYSALFVTFFFPFYAKEFLGATEFQIGLVFGISLLAVGLLVPFIGAFSDTIGKKLPFIFFFTLVCCLSVLLITKASLNTALLFAIFANFSYHAALTTYNALLPRIALKHEQGYISAIGVSLGYLGTLMGLGIAYILLSKLGWETQTGVKGVFIATSLLFFLFSLITFFGIKEKKSLQTNLKINIKNSFLNVKQTILNLKNQKPFGYFLLSMFFLTNAINAIIIFLFLFGRTEFNLSVQNFFVIYAIFAITAALGSFLFGKKIDYFGPQKVLSVIVMIWIFITILLLFFRTFPSFIIAGILGGAALGITWSASRPQLIQLTQKGKYGQYFGFLELTDKFSGVIGPIIFGFFATYYNYGWALASLLVFFIISLIFLQKVKLNPSNVVKV